MFGLRWLRGRRLAVSAMGSAVALGVLPVGPAGAVTSVTASAETTAAESARQTGAPVEIIERRTETERVLINPEGSYHLGTVDRSPVGAA
jgi:hypothetical protein